MSPVERLFALEQFGIKLGLDNIRALLQALGHPERAFRSIHVAGTNGKGSVAAMVERALRAAGMRTGRYTSPHLDRIEERVALDGVPVAASAFGLAAARVMAAIDASLDTGALGATPTFFEASTAIAFDLFREARVEAGVVEVGLGGRFDATNVLAPEVSAITSIALDHERHLGSTLRAIAFEKAGIARRGVPLVVGRVPADAAAAIRQAALDEGAPIVEAHGGVTAGISLSAGRATLALTTPDRAYPPMRLALLGRHQADNAVVAVRVLEQWSHRVAALSPAAIAAGIEECEWPGRLEWLQLPDGRRVLLDAAHNPAGALALAGYLEDAGLAPLPIVMAVMADKDLAGMVMPLVPLASRFVATTVPHARARSADDLARDLAALAPGVPVAAVASADAAVAEALAAGPAAVAAGSIFLIGPLRARLIARGACYSRLP